MCVAISAEPAVKYNVYIIKKVGSVMKVKRVIRKLKCCNEKVHKFREGSST
jgi:hypothetical protein